MEPTNPNRVHSGFRSMKVVGICGSPRKGNTEWMLRKQGIEETWDMLGGSSPSWPTWQCPDSYLLPFWSG